jgi:hypothetical protein
MQMTEQVVDMLRLKEDSSTVNLFPMHKIVRAWDR